MRRFLPISLFLSSILALALFSCSPATGYKLIRTSQVSGNDVEPVISKNKALLYKARIDLYNRHFSGLILLKKIDAQVSHLTFVTEIGMKMFDFEIRDTSFRLVYVFEPLNKPKIIQLLQSDMKLILLHELLNKEAMFFEKGEKRLYKVHRDARYYYLLNPQTKTVAKIIKKGPVFTKVKVLYLYQDSLNASQIKLKHTNMIRLRITLNHLNKAD